MLDKKLFSFLAIGTLFLCACDNQKIEKEHSRTIKWRQTEALLLDVQKKTTSDHLSPYDCKALFFFDTDGNPDTAEEMLLLRSSSPQTHLKIFNKAKIGTYHSLEEWECILKGKDDVIAWTTVSKKATPTCLQKAKIKE